MFNGFETTPMFGQQLFGSQFFSPQMFQQMQGAGWPPAWTAWSQGMGQMSREMMVYTKTAIEDGTATYRELLAAKSVEEALDIQTRYARRSAEEFAEQAQKMGNLYVRLVQQAFQLPQVGGVFRNTP